MAEKAKVCVVGSVNMDLVTATNVVPKQGETLLGDSFFTNPGGKGANQAIAASRMGANVEIIGAVGGDDFGFAVKENLTINGVGTSGLTTLKNESTGIANIILSESDNRIIVVQGANKALNKQMIQEYQSKIIESDIILMQLEIPMPTILTTLQIAKKYGKPVILNPAPFQTLPETVYQNVTYFTPNENELIAMQKDIIIETLKKKLIITKGSKGAVIYQENKIMAIPAHHVEVIDTTGAGDTFNGALAARLACGDNLQNAVQMANVAAALSVTKLGAQTGMPKYQTVREFIKSS